MKRDPRIGAVFNLIQGTKRVVIELEKTYEHLEKARNLQEKKLVQDHVKELEVMLRKANEEIKKKLGETIFSRPLEIEKKEDEESKKPLVPKKKKKKEVKEDPNIRTKGGKIYSLKEISPIELERETVKRIRDDNEEKLKKKPVRKTSQYSKVSSKIFSKVSRNLLDKKTFHRMERDLAQANLEFTPAGYISMILMSTMISGIIAGFLFFFFLFFNFGAQIPIITRAPETLSIRFLKVIWILFIVPIATFLVMYIYPSMERKSAESSIDAELPFAAIHMSSISGSMINPIKIFEIIISTKEYPYLEKEFKKMVNEINLYGYDIVSALKNTSENSPSKKLSELLNGLAVTITSGGNMPKFFDKRAETLLFDYRIRQQKSSKAAETFMDVYISILIAAPMILMLLMMIMKISGLGLAVSVMVIALMIIIGVVVVNIFFLAFLHLKKEK